MLYLPQSNRGLSGRHCSRVFSGGASVTGVTGGASVTGATVSSSFTMCAATSGSGFMVTSALLKHHG